MICRVAIVVCVLALGACSKNTGAQRSIHEVKGSSAERIAGVSAIIRRQMEPPSTILDAHLVEEQTGDNALGPADFQAFSVIDVSPEDVARWMQVLKPLMASAEYTAPSQARDWWVSRDKFPSLRFYAPDALTGRALGWVGVSQETGHIYIYSYTM